MWPKRKAQMVRPIKTQQSPNGVQTRGFNGLDQGSVLTFNE